MITDNKDAVYPEWCQLGEHEKFITTLDGTRYMLLLKYTADHDPTLSGYSILVGIHATKGARFCTPLDEIPIPSSDISAKFTDIMTNFEAYLVLRVL